MRLLLAVVDDLYRFAVQTLFRWPLRGHSAPSPEQSMLLASGKQEALLEERTVAVTDDKPPTFRDIGAILEARPHSASSDQKNTLMYVGTERASLYAHQTIAFDTRISRLPFGKMVMVLEQKGRWASVATEDVTGWMLRDDLADCAAHVLPQFTAGTYYGPDDPSTIRTRAHIEDMFGGSEADLPLQAEEYIQYRLMRRDIRVPWPHGVRPRVAGRWNKIFADMPTVSLTSSPEKDMLMEYYTAEDEGRLVYIESLFPDGSIAISGFGIDEEGVYTEKALTHSEWQAYAPMCIRIV